jgi:D-cysteine desulfhydrase
MLGYVNAGMELGAQVKAGLLPEPEQIVVPLGTGGTLAGLTLGLALSGLKSRVIGARVVPRLVANRWRVRRLVDAVARQIAPGGVTAMRIDPSIEIAEGVYGGAYGRALAGAPGILPNGIPVDPTYSAKAFVAARNASREAKTLFWMTFDSRWINA